eukprot:scaffold14142_cov94-Isochrysis_galbana.AAC.6
MAAPCRRSKARGEGMARTRALGGEAAAVGWNAWEGGSDGGEVPRSGCCCIGGWCDERAPPKDTVRGGPGLRIP